jgi:hypothetical protein
MFFPESPRHLMETDREDEALKVLRKLHFNGSNEEYIQREYHEIKTTIAAEKAITVPGWGIMFTVSQWRTRLMHGVAVQVFTQFTGISTSAQLQLNVIANFFQMLLGTIKPACTKPWAL